MRALLATAGLLVLAGASAATAGLPTPHTLRKSPNGPIEAVAQDGGSVAWLTSGGTRACDVVHLLSPDAPDRTLPQPTSGSMTCHWDLADGQPQLAIAARNSTALWTLHASGPSPFDFVLAASVGGPERQLVRLAHASNGTGKWLGGVAGSGKTLAYSWYDIEYVDKLACLSGGSCKQEIADGGIRLVTRTGDQPLPGAEPALQISTSAGRLAYIPAMIARSGRASATTNSAVTVVDAASGNLVSRAFVHGIPAAIALSPHVLAVLTQFGPRDRISWFSPADGTKLGSVLVSRRAVTGLTASDQLIVYRVNQTLYGVSTATGHVQALVDKTATNSVGPTVGNGQLVWAENRGNGGRLRALAF